MQRRKLIVGNWKMFKDASSALRDFTMLSELVSKKTSDVEVGVAAPSVFLAALAAVAQKSVTLFAENAHWELEGAFTGEVSPAMLKSIQVFASLVAHSERRQMFGETNTSAGRRVGSLLKQKMRAMYCVGETLAEREAGRLEAILTAQIDEAFAASTLKNVDDYLGTDPKAPLFSIAYEPVWAIGTGKSATAKEAEEAHKMIRTLLVKHFGNEAAEKIQILYGGSVKPNNAQEFLQCPNVDGALVGGASLNPNDFMSLLP